MHHYRRLVCLVVFVLYYMVSNAAYICISVNGMQHEPLHCCNTILHCCNTILQWYLMQHTFVYLWMECNMNLCTVATQYCSGEFNVYTTIFQLTSYLQFSATILCTLSISKIQFSNVTAYKCESTNDTTHAFGDQWGVNLYMLFHSSLKQLMVTGRT
jgi:hypothetical protein